ncbi:hypothetical protein [Spirosoma rhododendri]|uniref:Uncharacterized protein n=1 Tax=Spirosoma rhododendri TaxID=2728024 RepID=A0A7L5DX84_9BACT|nr:hypothetical protein [Spirosoma rhododendri]QJD80587.1 hypothetical protein HH216_20840 [Spirosoma rhododendri]
MEKLSDEQVALLRQHLLTTGTSDALINELIDHLACEVERYIWLGLPFDRALETVTEQATHKAVRHLRETYQVELTMSDEQLQQASLDDIVFQFRNKAYGAYDLRQSYRLAMRNAIIMGISFCLMLVAILDGINRKEWSYISLTGLAWILGVAGMTYAGVSWYLARIREQQYSV